MYRWAVERVPVGSATTRGRPRGVGVKFAGTALETDKHD